MKKVVSALAALAGVVLLAAAVPSASISGRVVSTSNAGLASVQVRLWRSTEKGWVITRIATTDSGGYYSHTSLSAGTYKLDAHPTAGDYVDRWYDAAAPTASGYVGEDADPLVLTDSTALANMNFTLPLAARLTGSATRGGAAYSGIQVRGEFRSDPRLHHNDVTKAAPHLGEFHLGALPPGAWRLLFHDPAGQYENVVKAGPYTLGTGVTVPVGTVALATGITDPNEPNNVFSAARSGITSALFRQDPPAPFVSNGAAISPRSSGDLDWYCFDALQGDRYLMTATTPIQVEDAAREDPWVDPILSFWSAAGPLRLKVDDDSGPGTFDARLDTGEISTAGRYCACVSTYGDSSWTGLTQGSAGRYVLRIEMGNRRPTLSASYQGSPVPAPPAGLVVDEGASLTFALAFDDPDHTVPTVTATLVDKNDASVPGGTLTLSGKTGVWTWTVPQTAGLDSPFQLRLQAADAEFITRVSVNIAITGVNTPPSTPALQAPADQATVTTATPTLRVANSTDLDLDPLSYQFELYEGEASTPAQSATVASGSGGTTEWTPTAISDNTQVRWRVRASDGHAQSGLSAWSEAWTFRVNFANDPPTAPLVVKPAEGSLVLLRRPVLAVDNPTDPDGDAMVVVFEVAKDADFTQGLLASPELPLETLGNRTEWTVPQDLPWGSTWFARARAKDALGLWGDYGNVRAFTLKPNLAPDAPVFGAPFDAQCEALEVDTAPTAIEVLRTTDGDGDPVTLQLQVLAFTEDPDSATPLFDASQAQDSLDRVSFDVGPVGFEPGAKMLVRARGVDGADGGAWSTCALTVKKVAGAGGCGCGAGAGTAMGLAGLLLLGARLRRRR